MIPRLQLFELEDQRWFPAVLRDFGTDYIHFLENRLRLHEPLLPLLGEALRESGSTFVVDLCSGGAEPVPALVRDFAAAGLDVQVTLTDLYPNRRAFEHIAQASRGSVTFVASSVDARAVPAELVGFRTLFNAFHHFHPRDARAVLQGAVDAGQPIGIFEISERRLMTILPMLLVPLFVWLATPFIRPFRWQRLLWTYLVPAVPLLCLWDGVVSQLRAYSAQEMRDLAKGLGEGQADGRQYEWRAGQLPLVRIPGQVTWLIGLPRNRAQ